jgi:hypothetical protein
MHNILLSISVTNPLPTPVPSTTLCPRHQTLQRFNLDHDNETQHPVDRKRKEIPQTGGIRPERTSKEAQYTPQQQRQRPRRRRDGIQGAKGRTPGREGFKTSEKDNQVSLFPRSYVFPPRFRGFSHFLFILLIIIHFHLFRQTSTAKNVEKPAR